MGWVVGMVEEILGKWGVSLAPGLSLPLIPLSYFGHLPLPLPLTQFRWREMAFPPPLGTDW